MLKHRAVAGLLVIFFAGFAGLAGCNSNPSAGDRDINGPPTIDDVSAGLTELTPNGQTTLTVTASDPDEDEGSTSQD